ncbi:MAG: hypothetical protein FWC92_03720 [Defluviitaleaceae bacterium]|nr:hypothetical protein [Defluviitaleaceae bacterium]
MYKRVACLTLVLIILACIVAPTRLAAWSWDPDTSNVTLGQYKINRTAAFEQRNAMYGGFEHINHGYIYPDFYAGNHVDVDGLLVISITESSLEQARSHGSIGPLLEAGVQYRFVEFSLTELRAAQGTVWEAARERYIPRRQRLWWRNWCRYSNYIADRITFESVCYTRNRAIVGIYQYDEDMIAGFKRYVFDSPMIIFVPTGRFSLNGSGPAWPGVVAMIVVLLAVFIRAVFTIRRQWTPTSPASQG